MKKYVLALMMALCVFLVACDNGAKENSESAKESNETAKAATEAPDPTEEVQKESVETETEDISISKPDENGYYTLSTEDGSNSVKIGFPEGYVPTDYLSGTWVEFKKSYDYSTQYLTFVLQNESSDIVEGNMMAEIEETISLNSATESEVGVVHDILIGELNAKGFQYSYATSFNGTKGIRLWAPLENGSTLMCIVEVSGNNLPEWTEKEIAGLLHIEQIP